MADLGMNKNGLKLKMKEVNYSILQKELAIASIELDKERIYSRLEEYEISLVNIQKELEVHKKDLASLRQTLEQTKE